MTTLNRAARRAARPHRHPVLTGPVARGVAASVITAAAISTASAGVALAADQPGVTDTAPATPTQPGVTDTAPPAPAPAPPVVQAPVVQAPSVIPAPTYDAPPVYYDTTPATSTTSSDSSGSGEQAPQTYSGPYNPVPPVIYAPRRVAPIAPELPKPLPHERYVFFSPTVKVDKGPLSDADVRNANGQIATLRARVATFYTSIGFPKDQASRTAASTTVGAVTGGLLGAGIVGIPAAVVGGVVGGGVGAATGAIVGGAISGGVLAGPGALTGLGIGAGVGAAAGGAAGAAAGALGGGLLGGAIGTVVGAGDPGGNPNAPLRPTQEDPRLSTPAPPHPDAPQFAAHLDRTGLPGGGKVDYVVAKSGDVDASASAGPVTAPPVHIPAAAADAPYKAAGVLAQTARDTVAHGVADLSATAQKAIPGLHVSFPQLDTPAAPAAPVRR